MNTVYCNADIPDHSRRRRLYDGQLFVYSARESTTALRQFACQLAEEAFAPHDPREAQHYLPVEEYVAILTALKPKFIHHPESKRLVQNILIDLGCDQEKTYFDVPRLRTATSGNYLKSGIAYAFAPHRDTWYSPPMCQLNWWMPIYPIESENAMAFHPRYWTQGVRNGSRRYDYDKWNRTSRYSAAQHVKSDTRDQPKPEEPVELDPQVRVVPEAGGVLLFSGNQLHSTVPNTSGRTRFSIDFRVVDIDDVIARREAPNVDSECTGTTLRDFLRGSDLQHIDEEIVLAYERAPGGKGMTG